MTAADARGFTYALEPVRRRREWKFEAALARLANVRRQLADCTALRDSIDQECRLQSGRVARAWSERPNPSTQRRLLAYLAAVQSRRVEVEQELEDLRARAEQARVECAEQQRRLEVLDQHRQDTRKAYSAEQLRKAGVQADHDWTARSEHHTSAREDS